MLKVQGKRVSLLDIAATIKLCPLVHDCVVCDMLSHDPSDNGILLAALIQVGELFVEVKPSEEVLREVRAWCRGQLPEHMRPFYLFCGTLPRNPNGKVSLLMDDTTVVMTPHFGL